jgi:hypothetical protein
VIVAEDFLSSVVPAFAGTTRLRIVRWREIHHPHYRFSFGGFLVGGARRGAAGRFGNPP